MKKLLLALAFVLVTTLAQAEPLQITDLGPVMDKLPALDNGIAWDFDQKGLTYTSTLTLMEWKGIKLNGGYARTFENKNEESADSAIAGLSYEITNLEKLGVEIPILKYVKIEPMIFGGWTSINLQATRESEFVYGAGVKLLEISF